jgi:predicted DNA-binding protein YlxM (UPF0122 family)
VNSPEAAASPEQRLRQNVEIGTLCAFYGGLLTEKQRAALLLHYDEDWSLGEVARQYGVSRQNIHDLITRSAQKLQRVEEKVGAIAAARRVSAKLEEALTLLQSDPAPSDSLSAAIALIAQTITEIQGEE